MSLIPDESYSFPDHFVRTVRSRKQKKERSLPPATRQGPLCEVDPEPVVQQEAAPDENVPVPVQPESELSPASVPAAPVAQEKPPRTFIPALVHLKRKVRYNTHLTAAEASSAGENEPPAHGLINGNTEKHEPERPRVPVQRPLQVPSVHPVLPAIQASSPSPPVPVRPIPVVREAAPEEQHTEFELTDPFSLSAEKWSRKFVRFVICEGTVLVILALVATLGLLKEFSGQTGMFWINTLTITAAVAATLIPIFFYAIGPTLPRDEQ
jgi:hypothetical protein